MTSQQTPAGARIVPSLKKHAAGAKKHRNLVPGAEMLGYGFHIFGDYSFSSATRPLFELGKSKTKKAPNDVKYNIPKNIGGIRGGESSVTAYAFDSATDLANHFQAEAGISGSYGAFSASFSTAYSVDQQNSSSFSYALLEAKVLSWTIWINGTSDILAPDVASDPDWGKLPKTFTPDNAHLFFAVFAKFGTHYISQVDVGGMLYYYYSISRAASYSQQQITMSASAEYNALIAKGHADAKAQWSQCAKNWTSNRSTRVVTVPSTYSLPWSSPGSGTWDEQGIFANWEKMVQKYPSSTAFQLVPLSQLFSGKQAEAVQAAFDAYASTRVQLQCNPLAPCTIIIGGMPITPPGGYPPDRSVGGQVVGGYHVVVLDRQSLSVVMNKYYSIVVDSPDWPDPVCDQMANDLRQYTGPQGNAILVVGSCYMDDGSSPNTNLFATLQSFGAGAPLNSWIGDRNHGCSQGEVVAYGLVGASGSPYGSAIEGYINNHSGPNGTLVRLNVHLQPRPNGAFVPSNV